MQRTEDWSTTRVTIEGFPANLAIKENLEKSFTFSSQGKIWEFEKKCFESGKNQNCIGPREKIASLRYFSSCPNSLCTG